MISAPEISGAASASSRTELFRAIGRYEVNWEYFGILSVGAAATGDIETTRGRIDETESAVQGAADDGLPDLLVPLATLAWALGAPELAARWITAMRRSPTPTQNSGSRSPIGDSGTRSASSTRTRSTTRPSEIYQEATDWLASL